MPLALKIIKSFENYWGNFSKYQNHFGPILSQKETSNKILYEK